MSQAECTIESLLMKERWHLIQTGIDCISIKIQAANIYVNYTEKSVTHHLHYHLS